MLSRRIIYVLFPQPVVVSPDAHRGSIPVPRCMVDYRPQTPLTPRTVNVPIAPLPLANDAPSPNLPIPEKSCGHLWLGLREHVTHALYRYARMPRVY